MSDLFPLSIRVAVMSYEQEVARIVRINSEDRQNQTIDESNKFVANFPNVTELQAINRVVIKNISIPNVQYNVRPAVGLILLAMCSPITMG